MPFPSSLNRVTTPIEWSSKSSLEEASGSWRTVLLVDDEPFILRAMARFLERSSFRAITCSTPSVAIDHVARDDIDLVVTDMTMPEMSGLELLCVIRKLDATLPTVLMTGCTDLGLFSEAIECGANEFLFKPFELGVFGHLVERLVRPRRAIDSCPARLVDS